MAFREIHKGFEVETLIYNERDELGDKLYSFKIMSSEPESKVYEYCTKTLKESYPESEKPHSFAPELLEFRNTTNLNKKGFPEMYVYRVKCFSTE